MKSVRRRSRLTLRADTLRELSMPDLASVVAGWLCTDSCDTCWSLALTCQGNTCTAAVGGGGER